MKLLVHVTAESGWPTLEMPLPGRLVAQVWEVKPEPAADPSGTAPDPSGTAPLRRSGLPPGLSFECNSVAEALAVIQRECEGEAYKM